MSVIYQIWEQAQTLLLNLFMGLTWLDIVDIGLMAIVIYQVIKMLKQTRANSVMKGIAIVLVLAWLSDALGLSTINWLLLQVVNTGFIVLVIIFQPELRRGLEQIGRSRPSNFIMGFDKRTRVANHDVHEMVHALTNLARRNVGALIVFEGHSGLKDVVESGTRIDAEISSQLIENIFEPNTPLHDGAVIMRDRRVLAAGCILQLSESNSISRDLGTRHRAAIGITESTDAVALIVSEETGIISMAKEGKLTRHLDAKALTSILTDMFIDAGEESMWTALGRRKGARRER